MKVFLSFAEYVCVCAIGMIIKPLFKLTALLKRPDTEEQKGISLILIQTTCEDFACQRKLSRPVLLCNFFYFSVFVFK